MPPWPVGVWAEGSNSGIYITYIYDQSLKKRWRILLPPPVSFSTTMLGTSFTEHVLLLLQICASRSPLNIQREPRIDKFSVKTALKIPLPLHCIHSKVTNFNTLFDYVSM